MSVPQANKKSWRAICINMCSRASLLPGIKRELLLQKIARIRSQHEFEQFADELAAVGIEPF
jgi:hypothetical protein